MLSKKTQRIIIPADLETIAAALRTHKLPRIVKDGLICQVKPFGAVVRGAIRCVTPFGVKRIPVQNILNYEVPVTPEG